MQWQRTTWHMRVIEKHNIKHIIGVADDVVVVVVVVVVVGV